MIKQATNTHEDINSNSSNRLWYGNLLFKPISVSLSRDDMFAVRAYFPAKTGDVDIDGTVENDHFIAPYTAQDLFPGKNRAFVGEQQEEDFELFFSSVSTPLRRVYTVCC